MDYIEAQAKHGKIWGWSREDIDKALPPANTDLADLMAGCYNLALNRLEPCQAQDTAELWKVLQEGLFPIMAAATESLTVEQLEEIMIPQSIMTNGFSLIDSNNLHALTPFFRFSRAYRDEKKSRFFFFHKTVLDWLISCPSRSFKHDGDKLIADACIATV